MPASMISAVAGESKVAVIGSSMAMVATGPTPGSTPINVPSSTPRKQNRTLVSVKATDRPRPRLAIRSLIAASRPDREVEPRAVDAHRQSEAVVEHRQDQQGQRDAQDDGKAQGHALAGVGREQHRNGRGRHQTE